MGMHATLHLPHVDTDDKFHVNAVNFPAELGSDHFVAVYVGPTSNHLTLIVRRPEDAIALMEAFSEAVQLLSPRCNATEWDTSDDVNGSYPLHDDVCPAHNGNGGARFLADMSEYDSESGLT